MGLLIALLLGPGWTDAEVVNRIKKAERAGFEHHDLAGQLQILLPKARWVIGRTGAPDEHDVVLDQAGISGLLRLDYAGPPGSRRVDFEKTEVDLQADPPMVELIQSRRFHGGRILLHTRFELARDAEGWGVSTRREWPLEERVGPLPTLFNDAFWLDADAVVEQPSTDTVGERFDALLIARRYAQLVREASVLTERGVEDPKIKSFWARAAFRLGDLGEAIRLGRVVLKEGGVPGLPAALLPLSKAPLR